MENRNVVIQPILAFIVYAMQSGTIDSIRKTIVNFYPLEAIIEAKNKLWYVCDTGIIGDKCNRKDTVSRTQREAHTQDILSAMQKLDRANETPNFAVDALSLGMIPKFTPDDTSDVSVIERQNRMDLQIRTLQESVDQVFAENMAMTDKMQNIEQIKCNSYSNILQRSKGGSSNGASSSSNKESKHSGKPGISNSGTKLDSGGITIGNGGNKSQQSHDAHLNVPSMAMLNRWGSSNSVASGMISDTARSSQFEFPAAYKKKQKHIEKRKQKVINGNATNARISGAPEPVREVFVYRVSPTTDDKALDDHLKDNGFTNTLVQCMSNTAAKFKSFKVSVPVSQLPKVLEESLWPVGIRVRRFFNRRQAPKDEDNDDGKT